jgi:glycosyltransferase involved in cell wall biosynthesis
MEKIMTNLPTFHIGFILEQALGHITHSKNLQTNVPKDPSIIPHWALIPMETRGIAAKIPIYKSNWTVRAGWRARQAIGGMTRQTHLDALFFHTQVPAILATNWIRHIPSVVSLDATPLQYDELGEFYQHEKGAAWLERWKWQMNCECFRAARQLVAWTQWAKDGLVRDYQVPAEKVTVIPPGVNVREWARLEPRARRDGAVKILFVGGDLKRKGGLDLLAAFRVLRAQGKPVELHLATRDQLEAETGLFVYNNLQPNSAPLKQLYFDSDIFCLPTYGDCLPMVLSEAGATGLPSVSTRIAGIPEIVADGETGLIVPRGDVPALVVALKRLIDHPALRLEMGATAVKRVTASFDAERNAFRLFDLIKSFAQTI